MQPNVHWSANALFSDVERFHGRRVVLTGDAFPSMRHPALKWAQIAGFDIDVVPLADDGFVDRAAVLDAVEARTGAVVLSHVGFTTGERLTNDFLADVADAVHSAGGLLIVDGYHAAASMRVDVRETGVDLYVGGLLKEASGSSGNAFIYVRDGVSLNPQLTGWFGHEDPFAFEDEPAPAAEIRRRFLGGTTAIASMYHAVEGVRILLDAGLDEVRSDSLAKTQYCIDRAGDLGLRVRSPMEPDRRSAMVIFEIERAEDVAAYLKSAGVFTDSRLGRYLRISPFVWNNMADLERTFDVLGRIDPRRLPSAPRRGPVS